MNYYLILFHKISPQLFRLFKALNSCIYIHPCKTLYLEKDIENQILNIGIKITNKRYKGNWGAFGIVEATIEGMRQILKEQPLCSHITLLSGDDFPIKPITLFEDFLSDKQDISLVRHWEFYPYDSMDNDLDHPWHHGSFVQKLRLSRYYYNLFNTRYSVPPIDNTAYFQLNTLQKLKHYLRNGGKAFTNKYDEEFIQLFLSFFLKFPRNIPLNRIYGGSQWFTLCRKHAEFLISYHDTHKDVAKFFRHIMLPDETYIQTILMNSPYKDDIINNNYRHIKFLGNTYHPMIFDKTHFDELKNNEAFFARKFSEKIDTEIIDLIEKNLI